MNTYCVSENGNCNASITNVCVLCQPLMWFVNRTQIIRNDSTIIFLPGNHSLNSNKEQNKAILIFFYKENLRLRGTGRKEETSTVVCSGEQSGFFFQHSSNITVSNLSIQNCGANMTNGFHGCVFFNFSNSVYISSVSIKRCKGIGLGASNVCGSIAIHYSNFTESKEENAAFHFKQCRKSNSTYTHLKICNSRFLGGASQNSSGIYLNISRSGVVVKLLKLKLINNKGRFGGNLKINFLDYAQNTSRVAIIDCIIEGGYAHSSGGGMIVWLKKNWQSDSENCKKHSKTVVTVIKTTFVGNTAKKGGGVLVTYYETPGTGCTIRNVKFTKCIFINNTAGRGSAMEITKHKIPMYQVRNVPQFSVALKDCTIESNSLMSKQDQHNEDGIVEIFSVEDFVVENSSFSNNSGTALMLVSSGVQFKREIVFTDNSARYGGAIKLCDSSVLYLSNDTRVKFLNNVADLAGGAIYAENQCLQETPSCFFQTISNNSSEGLRIDQLATNILHFDKNHAGIAGHAIYGGSVDNCYTGTKLYVRKNDTGDSFYNSLALYQHIFEFTNTSKISLVTSDPYGICKCDKISHQPNCSDRTISMEGYAGQSLTLYVSSVGQTNGSVPAQITVDTDSKGQQFTVKRLNRYNASSIPCCQKIVLAVYPEKKITKASFKIKIIQSNAVSESSNYYQFPKMNVNVTIHPCPFPFVLNTSKSCDCHRILTTKYGIGCNINDKTMTVVNNKVASTYTWVGYTHNNTAIAATVLCQKSRCKQGTSVLNTHNLGNICVEGRGGRVCGKCKSNYSLTLGPPTCIHTEGNCSIWRTVLLSIAFFLSGILLVCFLAMFNLTVAEGTINGLLFYANSIYASQDVFYESDISIPLFRLFISWLNLDFGFPVCFYSEMTAYQKLWLEFGYLFYLFLLGILIVCLSRKFIWFTRLTGHSIVPVLSTIILIAYPKLLRNIVEVWHCRMDEFWSSDNSTPWIWHSDETIDCFAWKHLILLAVSIPLFAIVLLYTLCLLFIQCLQRGSGWCVLRWVNKLRPFFDANTGPCRDHYQFWPGLLLFARACLYFILWEHSHKSEKSTALLGLCVFIFFLACVSPHGVYKKWPLNLLEFSFFLNLGIVTVPVTVYYRHKLVFSKISIGIAFFTFLLILFYHTYKKLRETKRWKKIAAKIRERRIGGQAAKKQNDTESSPTETSCLIRPGQGMPAVIQFTAPREPLLEDD